MHLGELAAAFGSGCYRRQGDVRWGSSRPRRHFRLPSTMAHPDASGHETPEQRLRLI